MANFGPTMAKFTGSEDPKAWIETYLEILNSAGIPTSSRHVYFSRNLHGSAFRWFIEEVKYQDKLNWDKLRVAFEEKWTPPPMDTIFKPAPKPMSPVLHVSESTSAASLDTAKPETVSEDATEKLYVLATSSPNSPLGKLWKRAFEKGVASGIEIGKEKLLATIPTEAHAISVSIQTNPHVILPSSFASISTQTEPPLPTIIHSESFKSPVFVLEPLIPTTISSTPFNWADDATSLSTIPTIPPKIPRDLSSLRSSSKNPFSSLCRRHHHSKRSKFLSSHRYTQFQPPHPPPHYTPPLLNNSLDWHRDPRLFELSRVLRTLGWSHP
jgi:hypothetical protein